VPRDLEEGTLIATRTPDEKATVVRVGARIATAPG
jgi:hypothetical protein